MDTKHMSVEEAFTAYGFDRVDTGGNCTGYERDLHGMITFITDGDGSAPESLDQDCSIQIGPDRENTLSLFQTARQFLSSLYVVGAHLEPTPPAAPAHDELVLALVEGTTEVCFKFLITDAVGTEKTQSVDEAIAALPGWVASVGGYEDSPERETIEDWVRDNPDAAVAAYHRIYPDAGDQS